MHWMMAVILGAEQVPYKRTSWEQLKDASKRREFPKWYIRLTKRRVDHLQWI